MLEKSGPAQGTHRVFWGLKQGPLGKPSGFFQPWPQGRKLKHTSVHPGQPCTQTSSQASRLLTVPWGPQSTGRGWGWRGEGDRRGGAGA